MQQTSGFGGPKGIRLVAPFPYFGGKTRAAELVWERFGNVANYVEPFAGSLGVLLNRPHPDVGIETVNDIDGFISNFWRSTQHDPEQTAHHADWPVNEVDLHARHVRLLAMREVLTDKLMGDPSYYDPELAGWWAWGLCSWIGSGWCTGQGPWTSVDGVFQKTNEGSEPGVKKQIPALSNAGMGVARQIPSLPDRGAGVHRQIQRLGDAGAGVNGAKAVNNGLTEWLQTLSARLRRVRVTCGDWSRVTGPSVTTKHGVTGMLLDPPYSVGDKDVYAHQQTCDLTTQVFEWCRANGNDPLLRIGLCGYNTEGHDLESAGWVQADWHPRGGYQGAETRERIWFSPHCLAPAQASLFD